MEIIVGTYEHFLLGYKVTEEDQSYKLSQSFASQAHLGCVRCISTCGKYLVSGSVDETIQVFNMKTRKEVGSLVQHDGTITCLAFFEDSHLFSSSDDKTICVWSTNNWQCLKTLRGHKDNIQHLSVHPSGRLILSVAKDKTLRTWNLVKGRSAYVTNIKTVAEFVHWSPDGLHFVVGIDSKLEVYSTQTAGIVHTINFKKKIFCLAFITENVIALGGDGENIELHNIQDKCLMSTFTANANRIKGLCCIFPPNFENEKDIRWLISASSDGFIKIWQIHLGNLNRNPKLIADVNSTCRITCLTVWGSRMSYVTDNQVNTLILSRSSDLEDSEQSKNSEEPAMKKVKFKHSRKQVKKIEKDHVSKEGKKRKQKYVGKQDKKFKNKKKIV